MTPSKSPGWIGAVGNSHPNLVCLQWLGRTFFNPKQFGWLTELVVDDPSHTNLQQLSAGRQITRCTSTKSEKRQCHG